MNKAKPIGERIRMALDHLGVSGSSISNKLGISRQSFQKYMDGKIEKSKHWPAIAAALHVNVEWLTQGSPAYSPAWANDPPKPLRAAESEDQYQVKPDQVAIPKAIWEQLVRDLAQVKSTLANVARTMSPVAKIPETPLPDRITVPDYPPPDIDQRPSGRQRLRGGSVSALVPVTTDGIPEDEESGTHAAPGAM